MYNVRIPVLRTMFPQGNPLLGHPIFGTSHLIAQLIDTVLGVTSPFFPGILLSRKPPKIGGNGVRFLKRTMAEKYGWNQPLD